MPHWSNLVKVAYLPLLYHIPFVLYSLYTVHYLIVHSVIGLTHYQIAFLVVPDELVPASCYALLGIMHTYVMHYEILYKVQTTMYLMSM
jgi:hypothetical protein